MIRSDVKQFEDGISHALFLVTIHSVSRMIAKREPKSRGKLRTSPYFVILGRYLVEKIQEVVPFIQRVNR